MVRRRPDGVGVANGHAGCRAGLRVRRRVISVMDAHVMSTQLSGCVCCRHAKRGCSGAPGLNDGPQPTPDGPQVSAAWSSAAKASTTVTATVPSHTAYSPTGRARRRESTHAIHPANDPAASAAKRRGAPQSPRVDARAHSPCSSYRRSSTRSSPTATGARAPTRSRPRRPAPSTAPGARTAWRRPAPRTSSAAAPPVWTPPPTGRPRGTRR